MRHGDPKDSLTCFSNINIHIHYQSMLLIFKKFTTIKTDTEDIKCTSNICKYVAMKNPFKNLIRF